MSKADRDSYRYCIRQLARIAGLAFQAAWELRQQQHLLSMGRSSAVEAQRSPTEAVDQRVFALAVYEDTAVASAKAYLAAMEQDLRRLGDKWAKRDPVRYNAKEWDQRRSHAG